jgi:hypothetical protein
MKPDYDVKPENRENCYKCLFNGEDVGLRVWGQRASHAEEKMMEIFKKAGFDDMRFKRLTFGICTMYIATK